jgi:hypothetical protein
VITLPSVWGMGSCCGNCVVGKFLVGKVHLLTGFQYQHLWILSLHLVSDGAPEDAFPIPNPWRSKAQGRVLRNVPIILYADDTSGNVSKQFNKHISFYFTLAGLPPHISNQEYNCHFLSTSNIASVCEMSEGIVSELK